MQINIFSLRQTATKILSQAQNSSYEERKYVGGIVLFPYFCLTDGVLTKLLLSKGGMEVNPVVDYFINTLGVNSIFLVKVIGIVLVIGAIEFIRRKGRYQTSQRLLKFAIFTYGFVCTFLLSEAALTLFIR